MSREVKIGKVSIGNNKIPVVQTMTNVDTADGVLLLKEIQRLSSAGAEIIRASVNTEDALKGFAYACRNTDVPLVADIHFDYQLAIGAAKAGAAKIRINPGNIGSQERVKEVVSACRDYGAAIRVGVNKGSLDVDLVEKYGKTPEAIVESAMRQVERIERYGFTDLVISVKSSDVSETVESYRLLSKSTDYPLHLGVTEAGGGDLALIKSSIGIGSLLLSGIGDTIRVSLSDDPISEVYAAKNILRALGIDKNFVNVISCPTCARTSIDVIGLAERIRKATINVNKPLKVAIMGCVVNGLGEGEDADIGVAGGKDKSVIFSKGVKIATIDNADIEKTILELINERI
ncbi:MAG: flavodoxin-dependent (E)-4-hydroxy-3-methylbut-2-enyl-diphosphate synthase [Clostridia bacterium]|nr:flavodoxin-dependent (E)-4-hydroxy-3-methylbut-2-enyl-diphosphate synthase [Clostridia bacterium]